MAPNLSVNEVSIPHSYLSSVVSHISSIKKCLDENGANGRYRLALYQIMLIFKDFCCCCCWFVSLKSVLCE